METLNEGNKQDSSTSWLDAWLARANHGLCPQARERVRREITAHHAEAVKHLRETGLSPDVADAQVLEGLGDAAAANKALRKTYLTSWQQRLLSGLSEPAEPITVRSYEVAVFLIFSNHLIALSRVCRESSATPIFRWSGPVLCCTFMVVCALIIFAGSADARSNCLRNWLVPEKSVATNRVYPWFLMACSLWLFALWRIQYEASLPNDSNYVWIALLFILSSRIHKRVSAHCFDPVRPLTWVRTALTGSYILFLLLASIACLCFPYTWALIMSSARPFSAMFRNSPVFNVDPRSDILLYSLGELVLALVLLSVAIRWTIGLYLLRKGGKGNGNADADPVPVPSPETPLGE